MVKDYSKMLEFYLCNSEDFRKAHFPVGVLYNDAIDIFGTIFYSTHSARIF
jgi:hypothetical protein